MFRDLHIVGSISEVAFEDARVKARESRVVYGYDHATPRLDKEDGEEGIDRHEEDAWYDTIYPQGEVGEGVGNRDVEGISGRGDDVVGSQADEGAEGRDGDGQ